MTRTSAGQSWRARPAGRIWRLALGSTVAQAARWQAQLLSRLIGGATAGQFLTSSQHGASAAAAQSSDTGPGQAAANPMLPRETALWALVIALGASARFLAARDGLWLDEVWSFTPEVAGRIHSLPDLFTRVHHENNHYLNTLAAWILGPGRGATWYRMPSIIAGAGTILTAGLIARRSGRIAGVAAVLLTAASYPLVHYSSEARGYAMAVFFGLVFWNVQTRYQETRERGWLLLAWLAGVLGILAQPLLICLVAASLATGLFNAASKSGALASVAAVHAVPLVFFAWIYAVDLRHAQRPGGPIEPLWMVVLQTLSLAVGGPHSSGGWWGAGLCAFCLHLASLLWLRRQPEHNAGFCLLAAWLMPLAVVLIEGRAEVYPRYFLPGIAILLINLGQAAEHAWQKGRWGKRLCLASLALFVAANGVHIGRLLRDGRGRFDQVVEALSNAAGEGVLTVGGDHDFRIETMLNYHASGLAANRRIRYFRKGRWPTEGPTWLLTHSFAVGHNPEPVVEAGTLRYALKRQFEYAGLSGWATFLYLRQNAR